MEAALDMRVLQLLTARLCHELIGPIAAIGAGAELLADDDPDFAIEAAALIAESARRAASRLEFYRFAYGFGGGAAMTGAIPGELASRFFTDAGIGLDYPEPVRALPLDRQKLACNLLLVGVEALPRGGTLTLRAGAMGPDLEAVGDGATLPPEVGMALALSTPTTALTSRSLQGYFAGLLARGLGCRLVPAAAESGRVRLATVAI